jgi:hypothetical protein
MRRRIGAAEATMSKLLDFPDELPDGALMICADWLRGKGDRYQTLRAAWHAQGYFMGSYLGGGTAPIPQLEAAAAQGQLPGGMTLWQHANAQVASMSNDEQADFLERVAGSKTPDHVGAAGILGGNSGFNLLSIMGILARVIQTVVDWSAKAGVGSAQAAMTTSAHTAEQADKDRQQQQQQQKQQQQQQRQTNPGQPKGQQPQQPKGQQTQGTTPGQPAQGSGAKGGTQEKAPE